MKQLLIILFVFLTCTMHAQAPFRPGAYKAGDKVTDAAGRVWVARQNITNATSPPAANRYWQEEGTGLATGSDNSSIVSSLVELRKLKGARQAYLSGRNGGRFYFDANAENPDDSVLVLQPEGQSRGRWVRDVEGNTLNLLWFGAQPMKFPGQITGNFDNTPVLQRALALVGMGKRFKELYIPEDEKSYGYFFGSTVYIRTSVKIYGSAGTMYHRTTLFFNECKGFHIEDPTVGWNGATDVILMDLQLSNAGGFARTYRPYDESKPGIWTNVPPYFVNVHVNRFAGNGLTISGNGGDPNYGNSNQFFISNCTFSLNAGYGIRAGTSDVNASLIQKTDCSSNGLGGFRDDSYLGITYLAPHTNSNGHYGSGPSDNNHLVRTKVNHNGVWSYYYSRKDQKGQKPLQGKSSDYWTYVGDNLPWDVKEWSPDTDYLAGGAYIVTNPAAESWFFGAYAENNQMHSSLARKAVLFTSQHEIPVVGQGTLVTANEFGLQSSRLNTDRLAIGGGEGAIDLRPNGLPVMSMSTGALDIWIQAGARRAVMLSANGEYNKAYNILANGNHLIGKPYWGDNGQKYQFQGGNIVLEGGDIVVDGVPLLKTIKDLQEQVKKLSR